MNQTTKIEIIANGSQANATINQMAAAVRVLEKELKQLPKDSKEFIAVSQKLGDVKGEYKKITNEVIGLHKASTSAWGTMKGGILAVFGGNLLTSAVGLFKNLAGAVFDSVASYQKYSAVLTNSLGSQKAANKAMAEIQSFAAKTPFQLDKLTESYIKLVNRGYKPTMAEMKKLGDLAAALGKDFDQLVEAMLDAQTGEFERLKEFGIRAQKNGDLVKFTFKGVTTEVKYTDAAIQNYILSLGDLEGVTGTMAAQSATLGGTVSNLKDSFTILGQNLGNKMAPVLSSILGTIASVVAKFGEWMEVPLSEKMEQEQEDLEITRLKIFDYNTSQIEKVKLIKQLKEQYPSYLASINAETATNEQLKTALDAVNDSLSTNIILQRNKEALTKQGNKEADAIQERIDIINDLRWQIRTQMKEAGKSLDLIPEGLTIEQQAAKAMELTGNEAPQFYLNKLRRANAAIKEQMQITKEMRNDFEQLKKDLGVDIAPVYSNRSTYNENELTHNVLKPKDKPKTTTGATKIKAKPKKVDDPATNSLINSGLRAQAYQIGALEELQMIPRVEGALNDAHYKMRKRRLDEELALAIVGSKNEFDIKKQLLQTQEDYELSKVKDDEELKTEIQEYYAKERQQLELQRIEQQAQKYKQYFDSLMALNDAFIGLKNQKEDQDLVNFSKGQDEKRAALKKRLDKDLISEEKYQMELDKINTEQAAKEKAVKEQQWQRQHNADIAKAIADGIMATIASLKVDPTGILAGVVGVTNGILIAKLASQQMPEFAYGGATVTGQSGRSYNATAVGSFANGGAYSTPSYGIIGEAGPELVIPNYLYTAPKMANTMRMLESMIGMREFAGGGSTNNTAPNGELAALIKANINATNQLIARLNEPIKGVSYIDPVQANRYQAQIDSLKESSRMGSNS